MIYFTGVEWWRSERLTAVVLPVEGKPCIVTPFFEEPSVHETLAVPAEIRVWQEDEDPLAVVAGFLKDRKLAAQPIAIEESVRFFAFDGLRSEEHTSELQSLMRISYAVFCLKKKHSTRHQIVAGKQNNSNNLRK